MADPPEEEKAKEEPKLSADMEAAKRFLAEHAAARAAMPQPIDDPRERTARWMRVALLVSALLVAVGLLWRQTRLQPVPPDVVAHARTAAAPHWAALSRCLVGEPLAPHELASSRMRHIFLGLPRAAQLVARGSPDVGATDHAAWPGRCAAEAHALTEALRPARAASASLGDLAAVSIGVYVALGGGHIPSSVDALFAAAHAAHLTDAESLDTPDTDDAPPPLALLDAAALEAHALEGPNVRVVDVDDRRVLLRGERDVLCTLDDADRAFACHVVPGANGTLAGLALVGGEGTRAVALQRELGHLVDLTTGEGIVVGLLQAAEVRPSGILAVSGRPSHGDVLLPVNEHPGVADAWASHRPGISLAAPRGELRLWPAVLAPARGHQRGLVAWTTMATAPETFLRVAETGDATSFAPVVPQKVSLGTDPPAEVTACADRGTGAVLVQLGELPPAPSSQDAGVPPPIIRPTDGGLPPGRRPTDGGVLPIVSHTMPAHAYQPVPTDLPDEHAVAVVLVADDGTLTAQRATISGDAVLSCEADGAVVTTLRSAADRTGAGDDGARPWRLREPGFLVTQVRCAASGCVTASATLHGFRDVPEVRAQDGRVIVFFRAAAGGGVRARVAPIDELGAVEDDVLADDQLHDGVDVREQRIGTGPRGALLVARTSAGVLAWRVGTDGEPRLLTGGP